MPLSSDYDSAGSGGPDRDIPRWRIFYPDLPRVTLRRGAVARSPEDRSRVIDSGPQPRGERERRRLEVARARQFQAARRVEHRGPRAHSARSLRRACGATPVVRRNRAIETQIGIIERKMQEEI